ncbi:MAG: hypothetical protein MRY57_03200 [Candidatus Pacebacteria bacterium]|nr:hypothetical protein [Candidatus Paceibacterota bacterium]
MKKEIKKSEHWLLDDGSLARTLEKNSQKVQEWIINQITVQGTFVNKISISIKRFKQKITLQEAQDRARYLTKQLKSDS